MGTNTTDKPQSLLDKATTQNIIAAAVIITALAAAVYYQKWEIVTFLVGASVGWLFPKPQ